MLVGSVVRVACYGDNLRCVEVLSAVSMIGVDSTVEPLAVVEGSCN
jgi:hypothetical protein